MELGRGRSPPATLVAVLERITYANEQTGYTVARVADFVVDIVAPGCRAGSGSTRPARCRCCARCTRAGVDSKRALARAVHTQGAGRRYTGEAAQFGYGVVA